jgi:hypothetical protein
LYFPIYDQWHAPGPSDGLHLFDIHYNSRKWLNESRLGQTAGELLRKGYAFDYLSDRQLRRLQTTGQGGLVSEGETVYKSIVVPPCTHLPLETLQALGKLASQGARILFLQQWPETVNGYHQLAQRQASFDQLLADVKKRVQYSDNLTEGMAKLGIARESFTDQGLRFIRKQHAEGNLYFLANGQNQFREGVIRLSTPAESIELYDALSGRKGLVPFRKVGPGAVVLYLQLLPGQSVFVKTFNRKKSGDSWQYLTPAGKSMALTGEWRLTFPTGQPALPAALTTRELLSWTQLGDSAAQWFSGTGRYQLSFPPPKGLNARQPLLLQLGDVREVAEVRLNGQPLGKAWSLPFQLVIPAGTLQRQNVLEVDVRNLSANRIRRLDRDKFPWKKFYEINFVTIQYQPFDASRWAPVPSGLLGPVSLTPLRYRVKMP